jgi:hypothetical protein
MSENINGNLNKIHFFSLVFLRSSLGRIRQGIREVNEIGILIKSIFFNLSHLLGMIFVRVLMKE